MSITVNSFDFVDGVYILTLPYATCSTAATTSAKTASFDDFSLEAGARIAVKFTYANTISSPTLNVNSTGAKAIYWHGAPLTSTQYWVAGAVLEFLYDGTYWQLLGTANDNNTSYDHPNYTAKDEGLYKVTIDGQGHVSNATAVTKSDITKLGIPAQDTTYVEATTGNAGLMSPSDKSKLNGINAGAEVNQNAFSSFNVGDATLGAKSKTDSLSLSSGAGIEVSGDSANNEITISNTGVRSVATGSTNGTISVNTNGTAKDVAVKGLGSAAYTASTAYDASGTAQTKADAALKSAKEYTDTKTSGLASTTSVNTSISTHNSSTSAHNDIRSLISEINTKLNNFLDVDDGTKDQLSEVLQLIEDNKGTLESLTTGKVNVSDIVDNLTTSNANKVLSAKQGVAIKSLIDALDLALDNHLIDTKSHITSSERTNWNAAKSHADSAHAPVDAEKNQNAFSNIAVAGQNTVAADSATDTLTLVAGSNVTITTSATSDEVIISASQPTIPNSLKNPNSLVVKAAGNAVETYDGSSAGEIDIVAGNNVSVTAADGKVIIAATGTITGVSANGTSVATNGVANIPAASAGAYGVTKLSSTIDSTDTLAATPKAVKEAYDRAGTGITNAAAAQSKADSAYSLAEGAKSRADSAYSLAESKAGTATASTIANGLMSTEDKSKLDGIEAGANKTTVDTAMSSTSTNPVQNKVVNSALANKVDTSAFAMASVTLSAAASSVSIPSAIKSTTRMLVFHNGLLLAKDIHYTVGTNSVSLVGYSASNGDIFTFVSL